MTTLVLSNHTAVVEDALLKTGTPVIACLTKPAARARLTVPAGYEVLTVSHWGAYDELAALAQQLRGQVDVVATLWEGSLLAAGFLRELMDVPGQSMQEAIGFTDKAIMKRRVSAAGIPTAQHRVIRTVEEIHTAASELGGYPVVVKPLLGFGSTNTHVVRSFGELQAMGERVFRHRVEATEMFRAEPAFKPVAEQGLILVEEYVDIAVEYHCEGFWADGRPIYQIPGQYNVPALRGMGGTLGSVLLDPDTGAGATVARIAEAAAQALGIVDGWTHAEVYRDTAGRWWFGEIAARPGGGGIQPTLLHAYGIDVPAMIGRYAAGQPTVVSIDRRPGVFGWGGPFVPPGRVTQIARRESLLRYPGVLDATVVSSVGSEGGLTGSSLWGGLGGYTFLHGDTPAQLFAWMDELPERYAIQVAAPQGVAA
ncbi:ATP-grasp domain-containing protein [Hamadaea tsunoensis]|uniref:ATP-grasp domain-containing protein n=1 Tax=Hamadaea tsunoensis TaxID=53368 RepID=UPI000417D5E8|nr:ATP-grasp domain-containing protein [Hamadaea tsunoensis]